MRAFICICMYLLGTAAFGQRQLSNFEPTQEISSYPSDFVAFAGHIIYLATDKAHGRNVWISDGTTAGTRFFFESESDFPSENVLMATEAGGDLYICSLHNIFKISPDFEIKKLNSLPLFLGQKPELCGSVLLISPGNFIDLKSKTLSTYITETGKAENWIQNRSKLFSSNFAIYESYNSKNYIFFNSISKESILISKPDSNSYYQPYRLFEFKNKVFLYMTNGQFFEIRTGKLLAIDSEILINRDIFYLHQTESLIRFSVFDINGVQLHLIDFDGKELIESVVINNKINLGLPSIISEKDSLVTAYALNKGNGIPLSFIYNKNSGYIRILEDSLPNISTHKIININDRIYIYGSIYENYPVGSVWATWLFKRENGKLEKQSFIEPIALGTKIFANKNNPKYGLNDFELIEVADGRSILIKDVTDKIISDFVFFGNQYTGSIYAAKNEKGKTVFEFDNKNNTTKLLYKNDEEVFYQNFKHNPREGSFSQEDLPLFGYGQDTKITNFLTYDFYNGLQSYYIEEASKKVIYLPALAVNVNYLPDSIFKLYNYNSPLNPLLVKLPAKSTILYSGNTKGSYTFLSDSSAYFSRQVFKYSEKLKLQRIFNEEVKILYWKTYLLVIKKSGDLYLLENNEATDIYYLMNLGDIWNKSLRFENVSDSGFVIFTDTHLWYSDGNCKNSKLILKGKYEQNFNSFYKIEKELILFNTSSCFYLHNGKKANKLDGSFRYYLGQYKRKLYFSDYVYPVYNSVLPEVYYVYAYDIDANSFEAVINYKNNSNYLGQFLFTIDNSKKAILGFGVNQYIINENYSIELFPGSYNSIIYENSLGLLTLGENEISILKNGIITNLIKTDSNVYPNPDLSSDKFLYLYGSGYNGIIVVYRINKQDYSVKKIVLPNTLKKFRTILDVGISFPINRIGNKILAKIFDPLEGPQLWELDDESQNNLPIAPILESTLNPVCKVKIYPQFIPETVPEQSQVFPNPTTSDLSVVLPADFEISNSTLSIISIDGKLINQNLKLSPYGHLKNLYNISLPYLTAGQYQLIIIDGQGKKSSYRFVRY